MKKQTLNKKTGSLIRKKVDPIPAEFPQTGGAEVDELTNLWGDPQKPEMRAIEPVNARIKVDLNWLAQKAQNGDKIALTRLVSLASYGATLVRALTMVTFEATREVAMSIPWWPVNISNSSDFPEDLDELRKRLNIGAQQPLGFNLRVRLNYKCKTHCREIVILCILTLRGARAYDDKKKETNRFIQMTREIESQLTNPDLSSEATIEIQRNAHASRGLANTLHHEIKPLFQTMFRHLELLADLLKVGNFTKEETARVYAAMKGSHALHELCSDSAVEWFAVIKQLVFALTRGEPEKNSVLREIGQYRADSYFRRERTGRDAFAAKKAAEETGSTEKTIATNIRDGIFTQMKRQFASVLKPQG